MIEVLFWIAVLCIVPWIVGKIFIAIYKIYRKNHDEDDKDRHGGDVWVTGVLLIMILGTIVTLVVLIVKRIISLF